MIKCCWHCVEGPNVIKTGHYIIVNAKLLTYWDKPFSALGKVLVTLGSYRPVRDTNRKRKAK